MNVNAEIHYSTGAVVIYPTNADRTISHLIEYARHNAPEGATMFKVVVVGETGKVKASSSRKAVKQTKGTK